MTYEIEILSRDAMRRGWLVKTLATRREAVSFARDLARWDRLRQRRGSGRDLVGRAA